MRSGNNFRIRHQNVCGDASQLPITAACTAQLPKALWCALMNKHLGLIGKCISRVPCCRPTQPLHYCVLASCPSSGARFPLNKTWMRSAASFLPPPVSTAQLIIQPFSLPFAAFYAFWGGLVPFKKIWLLETPKLLILWKYAFKPHFASSL